MNYTHLQEAVWRALGAHDTAQRKNWQRQEIRDALNVCYMRLALIRPFLFNLVNETTVSLVAGTGTYRIDDWCVRPLSFYIAGEQAREVVFRNPKTVDRDGSRNTNLTAAIDPWILTWTPATTSAVRSGAAASVNEGGTSVTGVTGASASDIGRMLRINGELNDYKVSAVPGATEFTIDKAHKGYLTGLLTNGAASNYTNVKWELGPPNRYQIQVLPVPTSSVTLSVRYQRKPRRLILDDDTPELLDEYHDLIWKGAFCQLSGLKGDTPGYQVFKAEWEEGYAELKKTDELQLWDEQDQIYYQSQLDRVNPRRFEPRGVYHRYG